MTEDNTDNLFGEVIHAYTRAQAIADGVLVDVTAGSYFKHHTAMTAAAYADLIAWDNETEAEYQDESGRLADVMLGAMLAAKLADRKTNTTPFEVLRIPRGGTTPTIARAMLHIGPGDAGEAVITIMLPGES